MTPYRNLSHESGVVAFLIESDSIFVAFKGGAVYRYDDEKPGRRIVEIMKHLARKGCGLSTFISQHVRHDFAAKIEGNCDSEGLPC